MSHNLTHLRGSHMLLIAFLLIMCTMGMKPRQKPGT